MSDRPTPETDAERWIYRYPEYHKTAPKYVSSDFARQLERQRDEARELARELRDALERITDNGHADDCLFLNRANAQCDCGIDVAGGLITKAKELLP